jgi:hypothetical protein
MNTLVDIVKNTDWLDVLLELEKEEMVVNDKMSMDFLFLFLRLHKLKPVQTPMRIIIAEIDVPECVYDDVTDYTDKKMLTIYGKNGMLNKDFECFRYLKEANDPDTANAEAKFNLNEMPREYWLGMEIDSETLAERSPINILAVCMWGMSLESFDEFDLQLLRMLVEHRFRDYRAMSPAEKIDELSIWSAALFEQEKKLHSWQVHL